MDQTELELKTCGEILQEARKAAGLSVEEIASKLYLSAQLIRDIENNDFSQVITLAYAKGYVRGYANVLSLPVDQVLAAFDQIEWTGRKEVDPHALAASRPTFTKNQAEKSAGAKLHAPRRKSFFKSTWVQGLAVLLIIAVAIFLHHKHHRDTTVTVTAPTSIPITPLPQIQTPSAQ